MAAIRIGVSGWNYDHWRRGVWYPQDLRRREELSYLGRRFDTVEINGSFYGLLRPATYAACREATPPRFLFAVKGGRFITHAKKLKDVEVPLANFFASGVLRLERKLGPMLWQFPAMAWDTARVARFLDLLPRDTAEAARLARRHDARVAGRTSFAVDRPRRLRHALEFRHPHFFTDEVVRMCRARGVALVFAHSGSWPYTEEITSGFVYLRLHGAPHTYASGYDDDALAHWATRIRAWADGGEPIAPVHITARRPPPRRSRDVYVYFDNDGSAHAPRDAAALAARLRAPAASTA